MINVNGESFVLFKDSWAAARCKKIRPDTFELYKVNSYGVREKTFICEKDYILNEKAGEIRLMANSAIKDFSQSIFFGKDIFSHEGLSNYGNFEYTVYANYISDEESEKIEYNCCIPEAIKKIKRGLPISLLVFGDSISTGAEAAFGLAYFDLAAKYIEKKYGAKVNILNHSKGGDTSSDGLKRFNDALKPCDIAFIAFGMNDQNKTNSSNLVYPECYYNNLLYFIDCFKKQNSEVIVLSCCSPNPKWKFASLNVFEYANMAKRAATQKSVGFADVYSFWQRELQFGKAPESLLLNNINHPNNYGHYIYFNALKPLL